MTKSNKQKLFLITGLIFIVFICVFATTKYINIEKTKNISAAAKQTEQVTDACLVSESNEALFVGCNGFF